MNNGTEFISVFNDVLGPVMRGPSSSHTAGAYRIAKICRSLFGAMPRKVTCSFDPEGSYAPTYLPLGVDLAFAAGMLGWEMTDARYKSSLSAIHDAGTDLSFEIRPLEMNEHPNTVCVVMDSSSARSLTVWAKSVGGGVIEIFQIDGFPVTISGKSRELFAIIAEERFADLSDDLGESVEICRRAGRLLAKFSLSGPLGCVHGKPGLRPLVVEPVFFPCKGHPLFLSSEDMVNYSAQIHAGLGDTALEYESEILQMPKSDAAAEMLIRYKIMKSSVNQGLDDQIVDMPLTDPSASKIKNEMNSLPDTGPTGRAAVRALAAMHTCNSRGIVCAAPTGGSAGVIPGVMITLEEELHMPEDAIVRALFAASAVGMVVARRATFAAETAGCQFEIGVAGAMAAAAVVDAYQGDAETATAAAAISLQNTMGLVCDPVQGGCEIPCHTRNAVAAANAFTCATLVLGGYKNPIPLDQTVDAAFAVGCTLPRELRCTALGGIAATKSANEMRSRV